MPFTLSHIAAALPAHRALSRVHLFTPAVIGTMVPDFHVLLPNAPDRLVTHSYWPGLFSFSLPVGLIFYALTLLLVKPAVLQIAPDGPYARLRAVQTNEPRLDLLHWLYAALAILGGAVTHLVWDGFTHESAAGVRMFPILGGFGPQIDGHPLTFYRWLQYGSSVVGLIVVLIGLSIWLWHARRPVQQPPRRLGTIERGCWLGLYLLLPLGAIGLQFWIERYSGDPLGSKLELIAVAGMRGSALTLLLLSLIIRARLALPFRSR